MPEVLTYDELVRRLGGRAQLRVALRDGLWVRVLRGAYADAPADLGLRAAAAALVLPPGTAVAGTSALWLRGAPVAEPSGALEVLVGRGAAVPRRPGLSARQGLLGPGEVETVAGLPCVRAARAAVDVARRRDLAGAVALLDATLHAGLVSREQLTAEVARASGERGVTVARAALQRCDGRAESAPESHLRLILVLAGLAPEPQYEVRDQSGRVLARVDLALVQERVAIEYDGVVAHKGRRAFLRDRQRQNELVAAGWIVLRFTAVDLRYPLVVVQRVREVLTRRSGAA